MKNSLIILIGLMLYLNWSCASKNSGVETPTKSQLEEATSIQTNGSITFEAANDTYSAQGKFNKWHFTSINMMDDNIESLTAEISIDLSSIWEKSNGLIAHLKAPDFLDVARYKNANIQINTVKKLTESKYQANMILNLKGSTQNIQSEFTIVNKVPLFIKGTAKVDRLLFGLGDERLGVPQYILVKYETEIPMEPS